MSGHNNPIKLALWESLRLEPLLARPDLLVSVGTGTTTKRTASKTTTFRYVFLDGSIPRLWRSYMASFDGEKNYRDIVNGLDDETRLIYRRLNVTLPENEPGIDDTKRMDELSSSSSRLGSGRQLPPNHLFSPCNFVLF